MIPLSELKVVENAFFRLDLEYNKSSLYPFIERSFSEEKKFDEDSMRKLSSIIEGAKDQLAHNVLLTKDMASIKAGIKKEDLAFDEEYWLGQLPKIHRKIEKHLGLKFNPTAVHFCDSFPEEYRNFHLRGASAITVFEGNEKAGIYYLNNRLDKTSTPIHMIHEQIHACLSQSKDKDQIFIEWFEEGIAIFYSLLIYYELTKDFGTVAAYKTRSFIFSRVKPEWDFTKRYFEYMKIISRLFLSGGFELLGALENCYLKKNRDKINSYLTKVQDDSISISYLPKNRIASFLISFSSVIEPEQITPLEYLIVKNLQEPKTLEQIAQGINAPSDVAKAALSRLFGKGICVIVKDNKIDVNWRKKDLFDRGLVKSLFPLN
jgi:hypothetical protein